MPRLQSWKDINLSDNSGGGGGGGGLRPVKSKRVSLETTNNTSPQAP